MTIMTSRVMLIMLIVLPCAAAAAFTLGNSTAAFFSSTGMVTVADEAGEVLLVVAGTMGSGPAVPAGPSKVPVMMSCRHL